MKNKLDKFACPLNFAGLFRAVEGANFSQNHNNSYNNHSYSLRKAEDFSVDDVTALSSSVVAAVVATLPQAKATNHTFKSLAFVDAFASSSDGGFAVAPTATETEFSDSLPIFDFGMPRNITGRTGHTEAIIKCRVDSLHDKSVSCRLHCCQIK